MTWFGRAERVVRPSAEGDVRVGETAATRSEAFWGSALVIYMRCLAALWVFQGLSQWAAILVPARPPLDSEHAVTGAATIFFAVLDLVAAVGLWLATPWGGVLWLFGALAQIAAGFMLPGFFASAWIGVNLALILAYFVLTWQAGRARRDA